MTNHPPEIVKHTCGRRIKIDTPSSFSCEITEMADLNAFDQFSIEIEGNSKPWI